MALIVGYNGKVSWQGMGLGSHSGHGVYAGQLLKEMLADVGIHPTV